MMFLNKFLSDNYLNFIFRNNMAEVNDSTINALVAGINFVVDANWRHVHNFVIKEWDLRISVMTRVSSEKENRFAKTSFYFRILFVGENF